jgi:uncharacterized protein (DUF2147 family)
MKLMPFIFTYIVIYAHAQSVTGKWTTIDEKSGERRSVVEIYEKNGVLAGKVVKLFSKPDEDPDPVCDKCPADDARHGRKIIGMEIMTDMKKSGGEYMDGNILDPEVGRIYRCKLWMEGTELKVRGYWGPFFRTQTWKRGQ